MQQQWFLGPGGQRLLGCQPWSVSRLVASGLRNMPCGKVTCLILICVALLRLVSFRLRDISYGKVTRKKKPNLIWPNRNKIFFYGEVSHGEKFVHMWEGNLPCASCAELRNNSKLWDYSNQTNHCDCVSYTFAYTIGVTIYYWALNGWTVDALVCLAMVSGSSLSLGKTPILKTVIPLQGLQWPAWKA